MAPVRLPGTRPRELETVAVTGGRPTASSSGKVTRVPEPTTALIEPAASPARATATISHAVMPASPRGCHRAEWRPGARPARSAAAGVHQAQHHRALLVGGVQVDLDVEPPVVVAGRVV